MACSRTRRLIRRAFVEDALAPAEIRNLWQHLRSCPGCRSQYDRVFELERVLSGGDMHLPSSRELALVAPLVAPEIEAETPAASLWSWRWLPALAAASLALLFLWIAPGPGDRWQDRAAVEQSLAVRAFCQTEAINGERIILPISEDPGPDEVAGCTRYGALAFAYTSDTSGLLYLRLSTPDGERRWLTPAEAPLVIAASDRLTRLELVLGPEDLGHPWVEIAFIRVSAPVSRDELATLEGRGAIIVRRTIPIEDVAR